MEIQKIGVYGAGNMGRGIAQVALQGAYDVVLYNHREATLEKGVAAIKANFAKSVSKGRMTQEESDTLFARLKPTTVLEDLADMDVVFEAVLEKLDEKKDIFAKLGPVCKPETIFVSNTSSLSVTEMGAASGRPEQFVGMHFFSPVPAMKLVEIVQGSETTKESMAVCCAVATRMGKEFIQIEDVPLFAANRIVCPMLNEAAFLAEAKVCSYEDIDKACELGYNQPVGPLKLCDLIGIDVMLDVMNSLYTETKDSKFRPAPMFAKLVRAGRLGKKVGKGFYTYTK
ncbi:MAG: 3-hydroxyacyl-CoA dehydrogenase NAD-binding domain-containing protein [Evtepia sp.]